MKATGEVGEIHIGKIEKKGRENRRFRIRFGPLPAHDSTRPSAENMRRTGRDGRTMSRFSSFVAADWLQERLGEPGLSIIDASWYLPAHKRDARAEYEAGHIPGRAVLRPGRRRRSGFDLPHTLPPPGMFARMVGSMGVAADDTIVVYDGPGLFSAPRVRWMFRAMGARKVFLLEGGVDKWKAEGRPLTAEPTKVAPNVFDVSFDAGRVADLAEMRRIVETGERQIADARPAGRFAGTDPEPRAGVRGGHMPGARKRAGHLAVQGRQVAAAEGRLREIIEQGRRRPREARRHVVRFGRHRGGRFRWRWKRLATTTTSCTTGHGANGAGTQ